MQTQKTGSSSQKELVRNLVTLIERGNAHVALDDALQDMPFSLLDVKPGNLPYSIWQLSEHIRIAQWDILEFSRNAKHRSPKWPDEYWPNTEAPPSDKVWDKSVQQ